MKLLPMPITNSSNFNIVVLSFPRDMAACAHELAYVAAQFFGSPAVHVSLPPPDVYPDPREEQMKSRTMKDVINSLQVLSPQVVEYPSSSSFPLYKGGVEQLVYVVSLPDVLRFSFPEARFSGVYKVNPDANWIAFTQRGRVQCGVRQMLEINLAILEANEISKSVPPLRWYEYLTNCGIAPRELPAFAEEGKSQFSLMRLSKRTAVRIAIGNTDAMLYWKHRSGIYVFVPANFHEDAMTNDLERIGCLVASEEGTVDKG